MMSGSDRVEPLRVLLSRLQPDDQLLSRPSPDATLQLDLQAGLSPRATFVTVAVARLSQFVLANSCRSLAASNLAPSTVRAGLALVWLRLAGPKRQSRLKSSRVMVTNHGR